MIFQKDCLSHTRESGSHMVLRHKLVKTLVNHSGIPQFLTPGRKRLVTKELKDWFVTHVEL